MFVKDIDRIYSFLTNIVKCEINVDSLFQRISNSQIPGIYDVEFVSVSLGSGHIKSAAVYLIEPSFIDSEDSLKQRNDVRLFFGSLFPENIIHAIWGDGDASIRIDPSYKSSDNDYTFRLEPQFDLNRPEGYRRFESLIAVLFPERTHVAKIIKGLGMPSRVAIELDSKSRCGSKIRLYYYDDLSFDTEVFRGVTVNGDGSVSTVKHYLGVYGHVDIYNRILKTMVDGEFFNRVFTIDKTYEEHNMSFRFLAHETSDYGVDSKFYFRNESVVSNILLLSSQSDTHRAI